jgi:flagellin
MGAMNANRNMSINQASAGKSMEKLSSGLRINRAGDDAAGLAISEKMRGQIRGLDQASANAQDGISMIQTAEGATSEVHNILQRMRELAVQSGSDTNTASDRLEVQKEVDQLAQEISRVGDTTQFNTQKLIDGSFSGSFQVGSNQNQSMAIKMDDMRSRALGVAGDVTVKTLDIGTVTLGALPGTDIKAGSYTISAVEVGTDTANNGTTSGTRYNLMDTTGTIVATSVDDGLNFTNSIDPANIIAFTDKATSGKIILDDSTGTMVATADSIDTVETATATATLLEVGTYTFNAADGSLTDDGGNIVATSSDGQTFTSGLQKDGSTANTVLTLTTALTATDTVVKVHGVDVSNKKAANEAITTIQKAIETVSTQRSTLGSYQNRLEHTIANLGTSSENLTSAESRIRDVNMAKEMSTFSKNNILSQAAQAMLAQANQQPQQVLQLLR